MTIGWPASSRHRAGGVGDTYAPDMTTLQFTVSDLDTAIALGSGDVPVLATPRIVAWLEAATVAAVSGRLSPGSTTVGIEVSVQHRRASGVGAQIEVEVTGVTEQGRGLAFEVVARELRSALDGPAGELAGVEVATGRVVRAVVERAAFLSQL